MKRAEREREREREREGEREREMNESKDLIREDVKTSMYERED